MTTDYPRTFEGLEDWAKRGHMSYGDARVRFAQYGVLCAVGNSRSLSSNLVLKGGNALDFVWHPNRSTKDLDFSLRDSNVSATSLRSHFEPAFVGVNRHLGIHLRLQKISQQPPGESRHFASFAITIGYALPDEVRLIARMTTGATSSNIVPLDISLHEVICDEREFVIDATNPIHISTLEDIVAEKLRSLLQQPLRNRYRPQDLLDIATIVRAQYPLGVERVSAFLLVKAAARNVPVSKSLLRGAEVRDRARQHYEPLRATTRNTFLAFDDAYAIVMKLVDDLCIPNDL